MIYTELTVKAMKFAYRAHSGQTDKAGVPYIFHPFHVAEQMTTEAEVCAALLHDVVEDTYVTIDDIADEFPPEVTEAVRLLTHTSDVSYEDYIRRIAADHVARAVKLADIAHNSDVSRLTASGITDEREIARLRRKYEAALALLNGED